MQAQPAVHRLMKHSQVKGIELEQARGPIPRSRSRPSRPSGPETYIPIANEGDEPRPTVSTDNEFDQSGLRMSYAGTNQRGAALNDDGYRSDRGHEANQREDWGRDALYSESRPTSGRTQVDRRPPPGQDSRPAPQFRQDPHHHMQGRLGKSLHHRNRSLHDPAADDRRSRPPWHQTQPNSVQRTRSATVAAPGRREGVSGSQSFSHYFLGVERDRDVLVSPALITCRTIAHGSQAMQAKEHESRYLHAEQMSKDLIAENGRKEQGQLLHHQIKLIL